MSRDNGRTPMQWEASKYAGFSTAEPWLPVNPNRDTINVANQESDPYSCLNHFRELTRLRNSNPVLVYGDYELLLPDHEQIYAYTRTLGNEQTMVILNFADTPTSLNINEKLEEILVNNYREVTRNGNQITL
jgi:oligo-1,6-glucosidase